MCRFASFVLTKDRVYWSKVSDSHEAIISENNLQYLDEVIGLVRAEVLPNDTNDLNSWKFIVDQDKFPEWTFKNDPELEKRTRKALAERAVEEKWFKVGVCVGFRGEARVGIRSKSVAGNEGIAIAGDDGEAVVGDNGRAIVGNFGNAKAGNNGEAISGSGGRSYAGINGKAKAGRTGYAIVDKCGTAEVLDCGTAIARWCGMASAGDNGVIIIEYWDGNRYRIAVGYVGEDGIKPNTTYKIQDGKFVEV